MKAMALVLAVAVGVAVCAASATAQISKTVITGAAPFSLGMAPADALGADPSLKPVATATCGGSAPVAAYATRVTAAVGGYPYIANVLLCFSAGKLGAIYLHWPQGTFQQDTARWLLATHALASQIAVSYAPALVRRLAVDDDMGAVIELGDAQGNILHAMSIPGDDPEIAVTYFSADYDQAVNGKRASITSY